jgi:thiamine kinase-like enzyme
MDPKEIGRLLRFKESKKTITSTKYNKNGITHWSIMLSTKNTIPLEEKIETLFSYFTDDKDIWTDVAKKLDADIFCGLFLDNWNEGFIFTPNLLKKICDRNLEIGFDFYSAYGPSTEK